MKNKEQVVVQPTENKIEQRIGVAEGVFRKYENINLPDDEVTELFNPKQKNSFKEECVVLV